MRWFGRMVALQNKLQNPVCYQVHSSRLFCQQRLSEKLVFLLKWNNNLCLFWSLLIKYKIRKSCKKVLEKNWVRRGLWKSFCPCSIQSRERCDCKGLPFELGEHTDHKQWQPAFVTGPEVQHLLLQFLTGTHSLCISLVCNSCIYENKWYFTVQKFSPKWQRKNVNKNAKVTFSCAFYNKMTSIISELFTMSIMLFSFQVLS